LQPHRPPIDGTRQQGGVEGDVVGAVVAVAAGALGVDAADVARLTASALARVARNGKTPWLWVQTVSLPSLNSANAQEGAIAACA
jgi:hypothetical protein